MKDILAACERIEIITSGQTEDSFRKDDVRYAAILHHLSVIGEAVNRLSPSLRERHPEVPWAEIIAARNRIVHACFDLDSQILWSTASEDVPQLRAWVKSILSSEFPSA
ncbi:MAG: DUF86 domain-containing protein [Solibacteraceae bacterium]|nr:DUF86 domain-containing protein [Solibacteraceae bacterium]